MFLTGAGILGVASIICLVFLLMQGVRIVVAVIAVKLVAGMFMYALGGGWPLVIQTFAGIITYSEGGGAATALQIIACAVTMMLLGKNARLAFVAMYAGWGAMYWSLKGYDGLRGACRLDYKLLMADDPPPRQPSALELADKAYMDALRQGKTAAPPVIPTAPADRKPTELDLALTTINLPPETKERQERLINAQTAMAFSGNPNFRGPRETGPYAEAREALRKKAYTADLECLAYEIAVLNRKPTTGLRQPTEDELALMARNLPAELKTRQGKLRDEKATLDAQQIAMQYAGYAPDAYERSVQSYTAAMDQFKKDLAATGEKSNAAASKKPRAQR
jgi:hypothetical protein